jgi:hypothetical protein
MDQYIVDVIFKRVKRDLHLQQMVSSMDNTDFYPCLRRDVITSDFSLDYLFEVAKKEHMQRNTK